MKIMSTAKQGLRILLLINIKHINIVLQSGLINPVVTEFLNPAR